MFDRKTKRRKIEASEELHGGRQTNYPSIAESVLLVQRQFEAEEKEGLMVRSTLGSR